MYYSDFSNVSHRIERHKHSKKTEIHKRGTERESKEEKEKKASDR